MKNWKKRMISMILAVLVVLMGLPIMGMTAFAEDDLEIGGDANTSENGFVLDDGDPMQNDTGYDGSTADEEDLLALQNAIDGLLDPQQLYYYTDEAILWVAQALGYADVTADAFLNEARANGYTYVGGTSSAEVRSAADRLAEVMDAGGQEGTLNERIYIDGALYMPNRDESKAHVTIRTLPAAVNGEPVDDSTAPLQIIAGDQISFDLLLDTDYYVNSLILPIVYDSTRFLPVDVFGTVYGPDDIQNICACNLVDFTDSRRIRRNYESEVISLGSYVIQYAPEAQTDYFMGRYKILAVDCMTRINVNTKVLKFNSATDGALLRFTLQATEDMVYSADNACVGCIEEWYPSSEEHSSFFFSVSRAAGYLEDGVTPAGHFDHTWELNRDNNNSSSACIAADLYSYIGQSCVCEPTFVFCDHQWSEWGEVITPTCTDPGQYQRTCLLCGDVNTRVEEPYGHDFDDGVIVVAPTCSSEGEMVTTCRRCGLEHSGMIPVDPDAHEWDDGTIITPATCSAEGTMVYVCRCNAAHVKEDAIAPDPEAHIWSEGVATLAPTCSDEGVMTYTCEACQQTKEEAIEIDPTAHDWGDWEIEDDNIHIRYCKNDDTHTETADHILELNEELSYPATHDSEGQNVYECILCHYQSITEIPLITDRGTLTLSGKAAAYKGTTLEVTLDMEENPGIVGMLLNLEYDRNVLELVEVTNGSVFNETELIIGSDLNAVPFKFLWMERMTHPNGDGYANNTQNGTILAFKFYVRNNAPLGNTTVTVTFDPENVFDTNYVNVPFDVNSAEIEIMLLGDANGDGKVDLKDVITLRRYLVGIVNSINVELSDANQDGAVNLKDAVFIQRALAGGYGIVLPRT